MIKVNIWLPRTVEVGHTSAQVGCNGETYAKYISWWPNTSNILKPNEGYANSYPADISTEKRAPDHIWEIDNLDEEVAANWWMDFLLNGDKKYALGSTNCSWAVIKALKAAGADKFIHWTNFDTKYNTPIRLPGISSLLWNYLTDAYKTLKATQSTRFSLKRPLVDIVDKHSAIWSPIDVDAYCEILVRSMEGNNDPFLNFDF